MEISHRFIHIVGFEGRPLSGKDTVVNEYVQSHTGTSVVSPGRLLRDDDLLVRSGFSEKEITEIVFARDNGRNIKNKYIEKLMFEAMHEEIQKGMDTIFLAGWPRRPRHLLHLEQWFDKEQKENHLTGEIDFVHLRIGRREANDRRGPRIEVEGRTDDAKKKTIRRRHFEFETNVWPMLAMAHIQGKKIIGVNARGTREEVRQRVDKAVMPILSVRR